MKGRVLAILTGVLNFVAILLWLVSFLFLIIVDRSLLSGTGNASGTASEQLGEGLGKAFALVFMIIGFAFLLPSVLLAFISGIGQCALGGAKKKVSIGFAIPALLAHLWGVLVFVWVCIMSFSVQGNRVLPSLAYIFPGLFTLFCFIFTIVALGLRKKFAPAPVIEALESVAEDRVEEKVNMVEDEIDAKLNAELLEESAPTEE